MSRHRFFVSPAQFHGQRVVLEGEQARQLSQVLRVRSAEVITVLDGRGWEYDLALETVSSDLVAGLVTARRPVTTEPLVRITLYQSTLKKDNFEWILQKGTELGVTAFVPVISQRSIVREQTLKQNKLERWQRILVEAAEQSGRGTIPALSRPLPLEDALAAARGSDLALLPWEEERELSLLALLRQRSSPPPRAIALFIGPEGGYAPAEAAAARAAGIVPVSLGPRILRAETAAIAATALVLGELGEMA